MKLMIIGHARHGKDTACEMLRDNHGMSFVSSSVYVGRKVVFDRLAPFYREQFALAHDDGAFDQVVFDAMFEDRVNHRALWKDLIAQYCAENPARTAEGMLADGYDVYCGMRARREFEAAKGLFDAVVWVDRSEHLPPEPADSMELTRDEATIVVDNNGSLDDLREGVARMHGFVKGRQLGSCIEFGAGPGKGCRLKLKN